MDAGFDDLGKARAFYSSLLGWEIPPGAEDFGNYSTCVVDGKAVAGIADKMQPDMPTVWTTYIATSNADDAAAKVKEAGGHVMFGPMTVGDFGRMAVATDSLGGVFGLWEAASHTGFQVANEPGTVTWNEYMSRHFDAAKSFYGKVFGYEYADMGGEDITYATFKVDGADVGGMGVLGSQWPPEVPANWGVYFNVENADASIAKAVELGGTVVSPAFDTPFGRMGFVNDDQGAGFWLMQAPQA
ncbi:VOC family protein [Herbihabitans rhizosphaerae]|uniref:VOC family protein n=1 Tax=Herbihabitans rhizosphaerae TaxID=1872711 RepID=UPI001F5EA825|nr:VOC family protein [Herbihabitans rhizosphaerae]